MFYEEEYINTFAILDFYIGWLHYNQLILLVWFLLQYLGQKIY